MDFMVLQRNGNLVIHLLVMALLLQSSLTPVQLLAYGRNLPESSDAIQSKNQEMVVKMRSMIGSRPPRCKERCRSCGHCEPIQVPIVPTKTSNSAAKGSGHLSSRIVTYYYRGDDYNSNYKPMCWKCKCGDVIFNP